MIAESEATAEVAAIYDDIKRTTNAPIVGNLYRAMAASPNVLKGFWEAQKLMAMETSLPASLCEMILMAIAASKDCTYCHAAHKLGCVSVGVDMDTVNALEGDLAGLTPRRVQAIIQFSIKCAKQPQELVAADYQAVRDQGVSDDELVEIIGLAALGNAADTLADAMKVDVDDMITQALAAA